MGLLSSLLFAPVTLPATSALWLGRKIAETVEAERNDPNALRIALRDAERQLLEGELSEDAYDEIETEILTRLKVIG